MNFANQALAQLRDLFESMTPAARITSGLLLSVVVISLFYLVNVQSSGGEVYLFGGATVQPSKLPGIQGALGKAQLSYEMEGMQIKIPRGQEHKYMAALLDAGALPYEAAGEAMQKAINSGSTFESKPQRAARRKLAKEMELVAMINKMSGVQEAGVFFDETETKGFDRKMKATALVSIVPVTEDSFTAKQAGNLRKAIAAAYQALKPSDVTVAVNGRVYGGDGDSEYADAGDSLYYKAKQMEERDLQKKILNSLSFVSGVVVEVSAELDEVISSRTQKQAFAPQALTLKSDDKRETVESTQGGGPKGPPGVQLNVASANDGGEISVSSGASNRKETKSDLSEQKVTDTTNTEVVAAPLVLRKAKVTVSVPSTHYLKLWRKQNPTEDGSDPASPDNIKPQDLVVALKTIQGEEDLNIAKAASQLLPTLGAGKDQLPNVVVVSFDATEPTPIEPPSMAANAMGWASENWGTISMFGLALFCLLTVRSLVKGAAPAGPSAQAASATTAGASSESAGAQLSVVSAEDEELAEDGKPIRRFASGSTVKDELAGMVRDDPDAAATILKSWLANAS